MEENHRKKCLKATITSLRSLDADSGLIECYEWQLMEAERVIKAERERARSLSKFDY